MDVAERTKRAGRRLVDEHVRRIKSRDHRTLPPPPPEVTGFPRHGIAELHESVGLARDRTLASSGCRREVSFHGPREVEAPLDRSVDERLNPDRAHASDILATDLTQWGHAVVAGRMRIGRS